jgi:probable rRNA maturation factor
VIIFETKVEGVSQPALARFASQAKKLCRLQGEVSVLIAASRRLQALNRQFRRKNKATDVLSFPRERGGDIAISANIAFANAARLGHSALNELKILVLHGMLHLAGYDHEGDDGQMRRKESRLRKELRLPDSLIERTHAKSSAATSVRLSSSSRARKPRARKTRRVTKSRSTVAKRGRR